MKKTKEMAIEMAEAWWDLGMNPITGKKEGLDTYKGGAVKQNMTEYEERKYENPMGYYIDKNI